MDIFMRSSSAPQSVSVRAGEFKARALRLILTDVAVTWIVSIPMVFSALGSFMGFFLMAEIFILGIWYVRVVKKNSRTYEPQQIKNINISRLARYGRLSWYVFGAAILGFIVYNSVTYAQTDLSSLYGIFCFISKWASPFLLVSVPLMFSLTYSAAVSEPSSQGEKYGNIAVIIIIVLGFILSYAMLFYASPYIARTSPEYEAAQQNVQTHDISSLLEYKTSGVPDTDILENVAIHLPGGDRLESCSAEGNMFSVVYPFDCRELENKKILIYNASALFALTDGLEEIEFCCAGVSYVFFRDEVTAEYEDFSSILNLSVWNSEVRDPLSEADYTETVFGRLAHS